MIKTVQPGLFTLVQDEGRWGYQAYGIPVTGAMDRHACRIANLLAGNLRHAAVLEMTMLGGTFEFLSNCFVSVCGSDMHPKLNGAKVPNWSAFRVSAGSVLSFDYAASGCRTYMAVRGGMEVPKVLGSRSTYTRARLGGLEGRQLRSGDILPVGGAFAFPTTEMTLPERFVAGCEGERTLRVIMGPQDDMFTPEGIGTFLGSQYKVTHEADRMGYRLEGPGIEHMGPADIISDAIPEGAVQVPAHGMPIVMMADRQTTGGYPKIATVIGPDLPLLAQGRPGDLFRFRSCTDQEAIDALRTEESGILEIQRLLAEQQAINWTTC